MTLTKTIGTAVAALVLTTTVSLAETNTSSAAKPATVASAQAKPAKMSMHKSGNKVSGARSEASKACSAEADAKSLHGQPRREFRKSCLKTAAAKPAGAKTQSVAAAKPAVNAGSATAH